MNRRGQDRIGPLGGSGMVGLWGASSLIASIQAWTTSFAGTSGTATITAVDTSRSVVIFNGFNANDGTAQTFAEGQQRVALTNSTTITTYRGSAGNAGARQAVGLVIEFMPGVLKSVQYVAQSPVGGTGGGPLTIASVNTAKSIILSLGASGTSTQAMSGQWTGPRMYFSSSTAVIFAFDVGLGLADTIGAMCIAEFF